MLRKAQALKENASEIKKGKLGEKIFLFPVFIYLARLRRRNAGISIPSPPLGAGAAAAGAAEIAAEGSNGSSAAAVAAEIVVDEGDDT